MDNVLGDLDKDGVNVFGVAYGKKKKMSHWKASGENWESIKSNIGNGRFGNICNNLYGRCGGAMMGEPFGASEIDNGMQLVSQHGGSSWK